MRGVVRGVLFRVLDSVFGGVWEKVVDFVDCFFSIYGEFGFSVHF